MMPPSDRVALAAITARLSDDDVRVLVAVGRRLEAYRAGACPSDPEGKLAQLTIEMMRRRLNREPSQGSRGDSKNPPGAV